MTLVRTLLLASAGVVLVGAAVVAVRTVTYKPPSAVDLAKVALAPAPAIDVQLAARHLGEAVRFQTVSHQDKADNDLGQWDGLHAWLITTYPGVHKAMRRELIAGHSLLYTWPGSDPSLPPIIMMAHQDVVPVSEGTEDDWQHPPFAGEIAGAAVWGRGTIDDKGALIGLFEAFETLANSGFVPRRTILLVSGHDEEAGGTGAVAVAAVLKARGVKALLTLDEGSVIVKDNPVTGGPAVLIGIAEKGYATLEVTTEGAGGHSSMPPAETAVATLARAIVAITGNPFPMRFTGPGAMMLEALAPAAAWPVRMAVANQWLFSGMLARQMAATPTGAAMLHTTIAPTMLEGSPKENVLPASAMARINYRIAPSDSSAIVMAHTKAALGTIPAALAWNRPPREPSPISSTASEGWKLVAATAAAVAPPQTPLAPSLVVAGTDSRSMSGVSTDVYRFQPIELTMAETKMIHGTNEHMTLVNLQRTIRYYAQLVATAAR
ncbi:MAG: M20 family peptidase [Polymorphobacter sp.]